MIIPEWATLALGVVLVYFIARSTKGVVKFVFYIITAILAVHAVQAAFVDWRFWLLTTVLVGGVIVRRRLKKARRRTH